MWLSNGIGSRSLPFLVSSLIAASSRAGGAFFYLPHKAARSSRGGNALGGAVTLAIAVKIKRVKSFQSLFRLFVRSVIPEGLRCAPSADRRDRGGDGRASNRATAARAPRPRLGDPTKPSDREKLKQQ